MNRKGISPLIATILLIAITIVVGAMITAWATTYISTQTQVVGGGGAECVYVGLDVPVCDLNQSNEGQLRIVLANTGTGEIRKVMARIEKADRTAVNGNVTSHENPGSFLTLGGQEAKHAVINRPADVKDVNLSDPNNWTKITLWVDDPKCPAVTFTIQPSKCR